jgi:hypothetical protein
MSDREGGPELLLVFFISLELGTGRFPFPLSFFSSFHIGGHLSQFFQNFLLQSQARVFFCLLSSP